MTLIGLLVLLIIVGVAISLLPMDPTIKRIVVVILVVLLLLWVLTAFGLVGDLGFTSRRRVILD